MAPEPSGQLTVDPQILRTMVLHLEGEADTLRGVKPDPGVDDAGDALSGSAVDVACEDGSLRVMTALAVVVFVVVAAGWFLFTSWQYRGFSWMISPPDAVHVRGNVYLETDDSPVVSLGSDRCTEIETIPISWKPVYICSGSRPSYVAIEWDEGEYYVYRNFGPARFWDSTGW